MENLKKKKFNDQKRSILRLLFLILALVTGNTEKKIKDEIFKHIKNS